MGRGGVGRKRPELKNQGVLEEYSKTVMKAGRETTKSGRDDAFRDRSRSRSPSVYVPMQIEERFCQPRTFGPNDVEIVVVTTAQEKFEEYAESLLRRLYARNIAANVLYLGERAPLDAAVHEFGRCGIHYVVVVMPRHPKMNCISVNVFEGSDRPTQEHRNLNIDEGVDWISRHHNQHYPALARLRAAEIQGPSFYPAPPAEVVRALKRMAATSAVPTSSLDSTIRYLQEMRDQTAEFEGLSVAPAAGALAGPLPVRPTEAGDLYDGVDYARMPINPRSVDIRQPHNGAEERTRPSVAHLDNTRKPYSAPDERPRPAAVSEAETLRQALFGLLTATGGLSCAPMAAGHSTAYTREGPTFTAYSTPPSAATQPPVLPAITEDTFAALTANPAAFQKLLAGFGAVAPNPAPSPPYESGDPEIHPYQAQFGGAGDFRVGSSRHPQNVTGIASRRQKKAAAGGGAVLSRFGDRRRPAAVPTVGGPPAEAVDSANGGPRVAEKRMSKGARKAANKALRKAQAALLGPGSAPPPGNAGPAQPIGFWLTQLAASVNRLQNPPGPLNVA